MRPMPALSAFIFITLAPAAFAAPVALAPISFSPEFQQSLEEDLGVREGEELRQAVTEQVNAALARRGASVAEASGLTLEISIVDADPNRPTMQQMSDRPGLDMMRSISIGGAELHGVLRNAQGEVISEITHRRYNNNIEDVALGAATTWTEARRAIRQFAEKVADAYVAAEAN